MCFVSYPQLRSFHIYNFFKSGPNCDSSCVNMTKTAEELIIYNVTQAEVISKIQVRHHKCFHCIYWKPDTSQVYYFTCEQMINLETEMLSNIRPRDRNVAS
jgi:hypothetical protein